MATQQAVEALRRLIAQPEDAEPFTTQQLSARLDDANGDLRTVAREIWREKAAGYAELVDVQEGSSRRALGDLHEQALAMATQFGAGDDTGTGRRPRAGTRPIVRP